MFYGPLRAVLFQLDAERAHDLVLQLLRAAPTPVLRCCSDHRVAHQPVHRVMGIDFPNRVGLAAGLDKNGTCIAALSALGFGFVEIGTVTPRAQPGNPKPRLFRLPRAQALVNRMGFNNDGVDALIAHVQRAEFTGVLGINIGKNADTPIDRAVDDYCIGLRTVYPWAGYVTVNISSPNTQGLRDLQYGAALDRLLETLKTTQQQLATEYGRYVPLALKIAPDMTDADLIAIAETLLRHQIDAVIATNTTFSREGVAHLPNAEQTGGLSGAPLRARATAVVQQLHAVLGEQIPIIAAGGIMRGEDAIARIKAGAQLVQLYTGLIYRGPALVSEVVNALHHPA